MTTPPAPRVSSRVMAVCTVILCVLFVSFGCESTPDPAEMSAVEVAKAISTRRKQAERAFATFLASEGDDIEALKRYAELHAETTKIAPATCELCYFHAGVGVARVASYYRTEVLLLDSRLQNASPSEAAAIEKEIEETTKTMRGYFLESNRYLEAYLRQAGAYVEPRAYWRLADNYAALEDWRRALSYLDLFAQVTPLAEDQNDLPKIRKSFETRLRLQEERQLDEELERIDGGRRSAKPQLSN